MVTAAADAAERPLHGPHPALHPLLSPVTGFQLHFS